MSPDSVLHMLQRVLKRADCHGIRFHDLRHTFANHGPAKRRDVKRCPVCWATTGGVHVDTYAHVTTDAQLKAAQTMGNILSRAV